MFLFISLSILKATSASTEIHPLGRLNANISFYVQSDRINSLKACGERSFFSIQWKFPTSTRLVQTKFSYSNIFSVGWQRYIDSCAHQQTSIAAKWKLPDKKINILKNQNFSWCDFFLELLLRKANPSIFKIVWVRLWMTSRYEWADFWMCWFIRVIVDISYVPFYFVTAPIVHTYSTSQAKRWHTERQNWALWGCVIEGKHERSKF